MGDPVLRVQPHIQYLQDKAYLFYRDLWGRGPKD
jgi:hypothetical protein